MLGFAWTLPAVRRVYRLGWIKATFRVPSSEFRVPSPGFRVPVYGVTGSLVSPV